MLSRMLGRAVIAAGLVGAILVLGGCESGVDKSGPATPPQSMDQSKQQQYKDFMSKKGLPGGGGAAPTAPAPSGAPAKSGG